MPLEVLLLLAAAKAALLIGAALLLVSCARRASAALRHAFLLAAVTGALLLPLLSAILPTFSPIQIPNRPVSASPELQRLADHAILLVLVRSDVGSVLPIRSSQRPGSAGLRLAILTVWLAGTAVLLFRIAADLVAARGARSRASSRGRVGRCVPLLESAEIGTPVAVGLFRPAILIPAGATFERGSLVPVIAHELAHVERRDCLTQLVARLACAVYWFNPLVWRASQRIVLERERACDDRVLASGVDPIGYSQTLIELARRHERAAVLLHGVPSMAHPAQLERRIVGILDESTTRGGMCRWHILAVVIAAGSIVAPLASFGVHDRSPVASTSDPFLDPQSERVDGVRELDRTPVTDDSSTIDGVLIATLRAAAAREPTGSYDLVPDRARWALSRARGGRIIEPLIEDLRHPDWRIRGYAAWALALSGDPRAVLPLIPLLEDPVWRLRAMAASALRQLGHPIAADPLAEALDDPAWQVRVEAVAYLGALREPRFSSRFESLRDDPHIAVRLAADEALSSDN